MQPLDAIVTEKDEGSASRPKSYRRMSGSCDQEQGTISLDVWKNAFREVWDRLCPIRAGGHECGCLPVLSGLVSLSTLLFFLYSLFFVLLLKCTCVFHHHSIYSGFSFNCYLFYFFTYNSKLGQVQG